MKNDTLKPEYIIPNYMTSDNLKLGTKITSSDDSYCYHSHEYYEIFYILDGEIEHEVNGVCEILKAGDIVFLRPHDVHTFKRKPNTLCSHRDIVTSKEHYENTCKFINPNLLNFIKSDIFPPKASFSLSELIIIEQKFSEFINTPITQDLQKNSQATIILIDLLGTLIFSQQSLPTQNFPTWFNELLSRFYMVSYMKAGLDEIIKPLNYDKSYICRTFKKHMRSTMSQYLCQVRLQHATFLLKSTDKTIIEIANDVGFYSISYFNSQFRKHFKLTPTAYRKLMHLPHN
jgi:AraC-like DNA-binding protein